MCTFPQHAERAKPAKVGRSRRIIASTLAFLKEVYGRAKEADKFLMSRQPALKHSWNTMVVSSLWDMRLSIACAATDAEYQNHIILHDNNLNLPVVAQQPHSEPNYVPHTAARRVSGA